MISPLSAHLACAMGGPRRVGRPEVASRTASAAGSRVRRRPARLAPRGWHSSVDRTSPQPRPNSPPWGRRGPPPPVGPRCSLIRSRPCRPPSGRWRPLMSPTSPATASAAGPMGASPNCACGTVTCWPSTSRHSLRRRGWWCWLRARRACWRLCPATNRPGSPRRSSPPVRTPSSPRPRCCPTRRGPPCCSAHCTARSPAGDARQQRCATCGTARPTRTACLPVAGVGGLHRLGLTTAAWWSHPARAPRRRR